MGRRRKIALDTVEADELRAAFKRAIVREFTGRIVTWEAVEQACKDFNFECKQAALFAPPVKDRI